MNNINLCAPETCTGCMACYNACGHNAIDIIEDEEGFLHPTINKEKCKQCGRCQKSCPIITPLINLTYKQYGYACWNKDSNIVKNSSSGGLFTSLAENIINEGGFVVGAGFDNNFCVKHIIVKNIKDLEKLRYSKYVQSYIGSIFTDIKRLLIENPNTPILFTGTPCQVAGLKKYLIKDFENLITCDFVCHGVPSPKIFKDYIKWIENKHKSKLTNYIFRNKRWSWSSFNTKATFANGKIYYGTWFKDKFLRLFLSNIILRKACYKCNFCNMNRPGDITFADFWGIKFTPEEIANYNDTGISLALINSYKGEKLFEKAKNNLIHYKRSADTIKASQKSFNGPWEAPTIRAKFWYDYQHHDFDYLLKNYAKDIPTPLTFKIQQLFGNGLISKILRKIIIKFTR